MKKVEPIEPRYRAIFEPRDNPIFILVPFDRYPEGFPNDSKKETILDSIKETALSMGLDCEIGLVFNLPNGMPSFYPGGSDALQKFVGNKTFDQLFKLCNSSIPSAR